MTNTTHYGLKKFENSDKMRPVTLNGLNDNADTIDAQLYSNNQAIGVYNYGQDLLLDDGSPISALTSLRYYRITGLKLNGTADNDFAYSIVFFWKSGSNQYVNYITKWSGHDNIFSKQYKYENGVWTLAGPTKKVTSISNASTNDDIPTAKAVYDYIDAQITSAIGGSY